MFPSMIIATRILRLIGDDGNIEVPVSIHLPVEHGRSWPCDCEIGWPRDLHRFYAGGLRRRAGLAHRLRMIAVRLYASRYHHAGLLIWDEEHAGYGFPLPKGGRDLAVGIDRDI